MGGLLTMEDEEGERRENKTLLEQNMEWHLYYSGLPIHERY